MNTSDRDRGCASGCAADFHCISQVFDRGSSVPAFIYREGLP
nr:MAG TPA: hypothetical protein [Caudoviricetes sp.]